MKEVSPEKYYDRHDEPEKDGRYTIRNYDRKPYDRRHREEFSNSNDRQSSPRLSRKLPYIDRLQPDRERYDRYQRDGDRIRNEERRSNSYDRSQTNNHNSRDYYNDRHLDDKSNSLRNLKRSKERELQKKSEHINKDLTLSADSSNKTQEKDHRSEGQKLAVRVCGDWSEHISSSGKRYFYNCKTEVSQWVKPKEWTLDDGPKDNRNSSSLSRSSSGGHDTDRNGSNKTHINNIRSDKTQLPDDTNKNRSNHDRQLSSNLKHLDYDQRSLNERHSADHPRRSLSSSPSSSMDTSSPNQVEENKVTNGESAEASGDDMDISPDVSPKQVELVSHNDSISQTTDSNSQCSDSKTPAANTDQNAMWGQALQTLQTLQEVLTRRGAMSQGASGMSESPISVPSHSPRVSVHQSPAAAVNTAASIPNTASDQDRASESANTESAGSPAISEVSAGHNSTVSSANAELSAPAPFTISLPPSLANFYDPSLTTHISDWPAEQLELRAHMANTDGLLICGHHCAQVSADIKRDRSSVRIAEVQSTLIEHRIFFLKQQISELETQDKNFPVT